MERTSERSDVFAVLAGDESGSAVSSRVTHGLAWGFLASKETLSRTSPRSSQSSRNRSPLESRPAPSGKKTRFAASPRDETEIIQGISLSSIHGSFRSSAA